MSFKKLLASGALCAAIFSGSIVDVYALSMSYKIQKNETFWTISKKYGISLTSILEANKAGNNTVIYAGQSIILPLSDASYKLHTVSKGETFWTMSKKYGVDFYRLLELNNASEQSKLNIGDKILVPLKAQEQKYILHTIGGTDSFWTLSKKYKVDFYELMKFNGANEKTVLIDGEKVKIPVPDTTSSKAEPAPKQADTKPYITYTAYKMQSNDTLWNIANKFGIPLPELLKANGLNEQSKVASGINLKIPVHHIPVKSTPGDKYGENLDWWTEAQYVIPVGAKFEVVDFKTGKSFFASRTTGANHADCEPLTKEDSEKMKTIWGGSFSWTTRPVIIKYNGRSIAASASSKMHAGNENAPGGVFTSWRSEGYGAGYNFDWIKGNGVSGHFDIHFANSTRHNDGKVDASHQANVKIAAGIK